MCICGSRAPKPPAQPEGSGNPGKEAGPCPLSRGGCGGWVAVCVLEGRCQRKNGDLWFVWFLKELSSGLKSKASSLLKKTFLIDFCACPGSAWGSGVTRETPAVGLAHPAQSRSAWLPWDPSRQWNPYALPHVPPPRPGAGRAGSIWGTEGTQGFNPRVLSPEEWGQRRCFLASYSHHTSSKEIFVSWFCTYISQFKPWVQSIWPKEKHLLHVPSSEWTAFAQPWTWGGKVVKSWKFIVSSSHLLLHLPLWVACLCLTILYPTAPAASTPSTTKRRTLSTHWR